MQLHFLLTVPTTAAALQFLHSSLRSTDNCMIACVQLFYISTRRPPTMEDVIDDKAIEVLLEMMADKTLMDKGLGLLHLASHEWFFSSAQIGQVVMLYRVSCLQQLHSCLSFPRCTHSAFRSLNVPWVSQDPPIRVEVVKSLLGRTVDCVNWTRGFFNKLSEKELLMLENKLGQLYFFVPCNPTGHYR